MTIANRLRAAAIGLVAAAAATSAWAAPYVPRTAALKSDVATRLAAATGKEKAALVKAQKALAGPTTSLDADLAAFGKASAPLVKFYGKAGANLPATLASGFTALRGDLATERAFFGDVLSSLTDSKLTVLRDKGAATADAALSKADDASKPFATRSTSLRGALRSMLSANLKLAKRGACRMTFDFGTTPYAPDSAYGEFHLAAADGDVTYARIAGYQYHGRQYDSVDLLFENGSFEGVRQYAIDSVSVGTYHTRPGTTGTTSETALPGSNGTIEVAHYSAALRWVDGTFHFTTPEETVGNGRFSLCAYVVK